MAASGIYDEYHRRLNLNESGQSRSFEVMRGHHFSGKEITSSSICVCSLCSNEYQFQQGRLKIVLNGFSLDAMMLASHWSKYVCLI